MSDTAATLGRKITSAHDLQSVVRAMKAMAASSVGPYERSAQALAAYDAAVRQGLSACLRGSARAAESPGAPMPVVRALGAVVFGSDQGLVGRFNDDIADHTTATLDALRGEPRVWAVGERVRARLVQAGLRVVTTLPVPVSVSAITPFVGEVLHAFEAHLGAEEGAALHLFYNRLRVGATYVPVHQRLLPLDAAWHAQVAGVPWPARVIPEIVGDAEDTLRALIREHLFVSLFRGCAASLASENASRLAAMERADKNITELLVTLRADSHQLRQGAIDAELFDVVSGVEALRRATAPSTP